MIGWRAQAWWLHHRHPEVWAERERANEEWFEAFIKQIQEPLDPDDLTAVIPLLLPRPPSTLRIVLTGAAAGGIAGGIAGGLTSWILSLL